MANFNKAYQRVARAEGGYQRHPNDSGNYNSRGELVGTNWGINAKVFEDWISRPPSISDMQLMAKSLAQAIYKSKYWNNIKGDDMTSQPLAEILFDGHVNHGYTGIKMMQRILDVADDGRIGPISLQAINNSDPAGTYNRYKQARIDFYRYLAKNRKGLDVFLPGWLNRINKFNDFPSSGSIDNPSTIAQEKGGSGGAGMLLLFAIPFLINQ